MIHEFHLVWWIIGLLFVISYNILWRVRRRRQATSRIVHFQGANAYTLNRRAKFAFAAGRKSEGRRFEKLAIAKEQKESVGSHYSSAAE